MSALNTVSLTPDLVWKASLEKVLFPPGDGAEHILHTYAVLDGASIPNLLHKLYLGKSPPEFACLYRGELEPDIAEVAPYLVRLRVGEPITGWVLENGWGRHWGIFVLTRADFKTLRKHLRTFLIVLNPEGRRLYFRYYDPRVLPFFLPTCDATQLKSLFGPISRFGCESADGAEASWHHFDGKKLTSEMVDLRSGQTRPLTEISAPKIVESSPESNETAASLFMRVREEQMAALAAPRRAQLPRKIARFLRDECPRQVQEKNDVELEEFAREQMDRAARRGVLVEWDVCRFCWLAALHGPRFDDECDWADRVLTTMSQSGTERMDLLESYQRNYIEPMFNPT